MRSTTMLVAMEDFKKGAVIEVPNPVNGHAYNYRADGEYPEEGISEPPDFTAVYEKKITSVARRAEERHSE